MIWVVLAVIAGLGLWAGVLVWSVRQIAHAIEQAYRVGSESAVRSVFGVLPQPEPAQPEGTASVLSSDIFEETSITPQERERMLARLAPWDHEEGNDFE